LLPEIKLLTQKPVGGWTRGGGGFGWQTLQRVAPSRSFWQASDTSSDALSGK
jgi:hypothetical protein